jgi:hypothetical protein
MEDINGLLGCPLVLPERSMFADGRCVLASHASAPLLCLHASCLCNDDPLLMPAARMCRWDGLPLASKVAVLASLQHGVCWLRELVAVFAPCFSSIEAISAAMGSEDSQET